ncbi:hypothetical protein GPJ56_007750 [Histomonas meleagridis]|uniref:uncharacterized protein n=1 Tax=Histomonas meleagridis TaxID=135588 RepID=UPI00355A0FFE|nr:hypothetical protein GPJ56_007750 [Histomonas meleagridis]KAH0798772.1 hypothetical protein GO595_008637 [Histomonas meleagridis]
MINPQKPNTETKPDARPTRIRPPYSFRIYESYDSKERIAKKFELQSHNNFKIQFPQDFPRDNGRLQFQQAKFQFSIPRTLVPKNDFTSNQRHHVSPNIFSSYLEKAVSANFNLSEFDNDAIKLIFDFVEYWIKLVIQKATQNARYRINYYSPPYPSQSGPCRSLRNSPKASHRFLEFEKRHTNAEAIKLLSRNEDPNNPIVRSHKINDNSNYDKSFHEFYNQCKMFPQIKSKLQDIFNARIHMLGLEHKENKFNQEVVLPTEPPLQYLAGIDENEKIRRERIVIQYRDIVTAFESVFKNYRLEIYTQMEIFVKSADFCVKSQKQRQQQQQQQMNAGSPNMQNEQMQRMM